MYIAVVEAPCNGATHRVGITKKREFVPLDHDPDMVNAFKAFGAESPPCIRHFEEEIERTPYKTPRAAFGWWLLNAWKLFTSKELYELTLLADPSRRVAIVKLRHESLTPAQIMGIMRTRGIKDEDKAKVALEVPLPAEEARELVENAPDEMQCEIAVHAGDWLPPKKRVEYGWDCREPIIIDSIMPRLSLTTVLKLAKQFGPHHLSHYRDYKGRIQPTYGDYENRIKVAMSNDFAFTPAQRVSLIASLPKGTQSSVVGARRLHRRRKHFELPPDLIKRLERMMG
jgi:hypothetical protein